MSTQAAIADSIASRPAPRRWAVFAILFALMVVDYLDRQVVVSMFPHLKEQWNLSDSELGGLVSIVSIAVAIGAVPLSLFADRCGRVKSIFIMVLVWSAATLACAFARDYGTLVGARAIVGLGEAAYGTAGAALLATLFPPRMRSTVLGAFLAAAILGSVSGVMLGGFIAERWGWQAGFGAVAIPGFVLALVFFATVRDYETVALPRAAASGARMTTRLVVRELLRPKTALVTCVGAGFNLLVVSTMYAWLPSFFHRYYGLAPDQAGVKTAVVVMLGGVGALGCSMIADRMSRRMPSARLMVPAFAALLTTAFMCVAFGMLSPGPAQFALIMAGAVVMAGSVGPTDAVVIDVTHPSLRATAVSVLSLTRNLFGLAGGPLLAGALSDRYGLQFAMAVVPVFGLLAAALFMRAARTYPADLRSAAGA